MKQNTVSESVWDNGQRQASVERRCKGVLKLGLDVHYRQVTVAMEKEEGRIKAAGRMGHDGGENWVERKSGARSGTYSCYESRSNGPQLPRELLHTGGQKT